MQSLWQIYATIYLNAGNTDMAMLYHDSIIKLAKLHSNLYQIRGSYEDIYLIELERGNHKEALEAYIQVGIYSDSIFDLEKAELMNDLRLKYEKEKDQLEILELKHKNLQKTKERNLLFFTVLGIVLLGIFLIAFLVFNHRKNKIISAQKIRQLEEEKKHLAARFLVEGEERERKRVAMELHDNLGVLLSATKMSFSEIRDKSPENAELITKASRLLEQASSDVRKISHNLMPGLLTKLGLYEALEELFENLNDQHGMDAFMEVVGPKNRLDENTEIMIYRMMQEIINNTLKHAEAKSVDMVMIVDENEINITYSDDGKGFDPDQTLKKKTLGLQSIRSRVKFLSGLFSIKSEPGVGTVYRICIPITEGYCSELSE
jgi:signal transduction histidine kinase